MSKKKAEGKASRQRFSAEFKQQALLRAAQAGIPAVAVELGLPPSQLYAWRARAQQRGEDAEAQRLSQSETSRLRREVERLEQEIAFLKKAAAYFAKQPK
jgi:transposase